jgi:hypothetical protein
MTGSGRASCTLHSPSTGIYALHQCYIVHPSAEKQISNPRAGMAVIAVKTARMVNTRSAVPSDIRTEETSRKKWYKRHDKNDAATFSSQILLGYWPLNP